MYYKLIDGQNIVGVATSLDLCKFQRKHGILLSCDEDHAQYIRYGDSLYHDVWMCPISAPPDEPASIIKITTIGEAEYFTILNAIETSNELELVDEPEIIEEPITEPYTDEDEQLTLDFVKAAKINEMSAACSKHIVDGFDVILSDGEVSHFSLTVQDQLNFITLSVLVANGRETIPYHADGKLCHYYTAADMQIILDAATNHKAYHTTYFNSLKKYIESLDTILSVRQIEYGTEVPVQYMSEVLLDMYQNAESEA